METKCSDAIQKFTVEKLRDFRPFPSASERRPYEALPKQVRETALQEGERFLGNPFPQIKATDFMNFKRTGNRVDFENLYFARRRALNGLVLAECMEGNGRFLDDIINGIFAICEESAWQLPPHNSYLRNAPQFILPDITRPVLDLFACETGAMLAVIAYLLQKQLDETSPFITKRIFHELENRILKPYLTEHFWWMGREDEEMCNWTVWCTQNVLLTVFLGGFSPKDRMAVLQKAALSCDYFLKDYGEDGCCDEGAQYYRHAGLCLFGALDLMDQVTAGAFTPLFHWDKVKNIAAYIYQVHVDDKYYFNFADCSPVAGRAGVREYLFGKRTAQPDLMQFAAKDFVTSGCQLYNDEGINLFYRMQTVFTYEETLTYARQAVSLPPVPHKDLFYPSVGLFLARSSAFSLAVKAGDNADSHNHNDTGSLTVYKNGRPVLVDIGVESYTLKTFSPRRYEIWTMQSCYHNLPSINGTDQKDGPQYGASQVRTSFTDKEASISMELAGAYPLDNKHISYIRKVVLDKRANRILLTDTTNAKEITLHFITYEQPVLSEGKIQVGSLASLSYTGASPVAVETLPITDARLKKAWDHDLYRIVLTMKESEGTQFCLCVE